MKKVLSIILSLALVVGMLPTAAIAAPVTEEQNRPTEEPALPKEQLELPPEPQSVPMPRELPPAAESAPQVSLLTLAPGEVVGGKCGDNLTWELAESTGTLTISGTGAMWDYRYDNAAPWCAYANQMRRLLIADGVTTIGDDAFYGCTGFIGNLILPSGLTVIGEYAFSRCSGFTGDLTLPSVLATIGGGAFEGCSGLTGDLTLPSGVTTIGVRTFYACNGFTGNLIIPSGVTTIDEGAFFYCSGFTGNLTLPSGLTTIERYAFRDCSGFAGNLTLPSGVTAIEYQAFYDCSGLTGNLTIPSGVTTIGGSAFYNCSGLTSAQFMGNAPTTIHSANSTYRPFPSTLPLYYNPAKTGWTTPTWQGYKTIPLRSTDSMETEAGGNLQIGAVATTNLVLTIYENKKGSEKRNNDYQLSQGASVTIGNVTHVTDKHGRMTLSIPAGGITVYKEGYLSRRLTAEQVRKNPTIYLQKTSEYPVLNALWVDGTKDVLNGSYPIDLLSDQVLQLSAEVDWGNSGAQSLMLRQGAKTIPFSGTTLSARLADSFDVGKPIFLLATAADGKQSQKELGFVQSGAAALSDFQVSFGDKIKVTLPESAPFFGGREVGAAIYLPVEVIVEVENGKIYAAIGAQRDIAYKEGKWSVKSFSQSLKDAKESLEKLKNFKKTYKDHMKNMEGKCGFDMGFSVMGFAEGYIDSSGQIIWLDSGILVEGETKLGGSFPLKMMPFPMFLEWELSGKAEARLNIYINNAVKQFTPRGTISGELKLGGGLGVGISKVLSASGGATGKLVPTWEINIDKSDYFKLVASLNFYAKGNLAFLECKHEFNPICEAVWAEYPSAGSLGALSVGDVSLYDTEQYVLSGREYLNQPSEFLANGSEVSLLSSASTTGISTVVSNVYPQTEPQLVLFKDGTKLAVWVADDGTAGTTNRSALYYSYYNGTAWATPAPVQKDGTADFAPQLIVENNTAYLAWQDAATTFADTATLEDMARQMDISVGVFDGTTHSFTCQRFANASIDLLPTLCAADGGAHVVWINNSRNDWFGKNNANSILSSSYSGGQWSAPTVRHSGLNSMNRVSADCTGGVLSIAYCADGDNNLDDVTDMELYLNGEKISANAVPDTGATFQGGKLYWYSGGNVFRLDDAKQSTALLPPGAMPTDLFEIVEQGATKALLYTQGSGLYSTLKAVFYDAGINKWSEPVALTDGKSFIRSFSGALTGDGKLLVLFNQTAVTGQITDVEPYGKTDLMLLEATLHTDISVGEIFADQSAYVVGNTLPLQFAITNKGELTANGCIFEILNSTDRVLTTQLFDKPLLPGQTVEATAYYNVAAVSPQTSLRLRVSPMGGTDTNLADNSASITLNCVDVAVENMASGRDETSRAVVYANVVNRGYTAMSNLTVTLHKDTANGAIVAAKPIGALAPLAVEAMSFDVPDVANQLYFMTVDGCAEDSQRSNNTDFVLLEAQNKRSAKLLALEQDFIELSLQNNPACDLMVAAYDASGKLLTVGMAQVAADTEIARLPVAGLDKNAVKTCKVFFLDASANLQPLCEAIVLTNSAG